MNHSNKPTDFIKAKDCLAGRHEVAPNVPSSSFLHRTLNTSLFPPFPSSCKVAVFGLGCVWCCEAVFLSKTPPNSLFTTHCGYAGGITPNPTNEEVHTGRTNHCEVVRVVYHPDKVSYRQLLRIFFESHDPTQKNGQGDDDIGTEYRSAIYTVDEEQLLLAKEAADAMKSLLIERRKKKNEDATDEIEVYTEIKPFDGIFYYAEEEHQQHDWIPNITAGCGLVPLGIKFPSSWH